MRLSDLAEDPLVPPRGLGQCFETPQRFDQDLLSRTLHAGHEYQLATAKLLEQMPDGAQRITEPGIGLGAGVLGLLSLARHGLGGGELLQVEDRGSWDEQKGGQ
jgi:hypothetical protein